MTATELFAALLDGLTDDDSPTRRIVLVDARDLVTGGAGAARQRPFAAVLGCSDARRRAIARLRADLLFEIARMRGELARAVRANADQAELARIERIVVWLEASTRCFAALCSPGQKEVAQI